MSILGTVAVLFKHQKRSKNVIIGLYLLFNVIGTVVSRFVEGQGFTILFFLLFNKVSDQLVFFHHKKADDAF